MKTMLFVHFIFAVKLSTNEGTFKHLKVLEC